MLEVRGATVRYGSVLALDHADLAVGDDEVMAVMGPSGSGKSTLLRAIAGLEPLAAGEILWAGSSLSGVPPHRRGFGLMFQDLALFPHRSVAGNVGFGLRMQGLSGPAIDRQVGEALDLVGMGALAHRSVAALSGGERQRVALARTIAPRPRMVMLDEPLGSLDRALRDRLLVELRQIFEAVGSAVLYVTHDQEEAFAVADRVAVMDAGRVIRRGRPTDVWTNPGSVAVARFLGFDEIHEGMARGGAIDAGWVRFDADGTPDGPVRFVVRPEAVQVDTHGALEGTVTAATFRRGDHELRVAIADGPELTLRTDRARDVGSQMRLSMDPAGISILEE